jgi:transposase InsO family protein
MDPFTRRIIGLGVQAGEVDGRARCRMFNHAIAGQGPPRYLSSDHDRLFELQQWQANLRILGVEEIKSVPCSPRSHPFVERVIGTLRREYLDHVFFWNAVDLERKLDEFKEYYNRHRVHSSLGGDTPAEVGENGPTLRAEFGNFRWQSHCGGLYQLPMAA